MDDQPGQPTLSADGTGFAAGRPPADAVNFRQMKATSKAFDYVVKNGKRTAVILPIDEYEELLQDLDDLAVIARRKNEPTIPLAEVKRRLKRL